MNNNPRATAIVTDSLLAMMADVSLEADTVEDYADHIVRDLSEYAEAVRAWTTLRDAAELLPERLRPALIEMADEIQSEYPGVELC